MAGIRNRNPDVIENFLIKWGPLGNGGKYAHFAAKQAVEAGTAGPWTRALAKHDAHDIQVSEQETGMQLVQSGEMLLQTAEGEQ